MSAEPTYVTCRCQHCNGNIEFDANQLEGTESCTVECPHCQLETVLSLSTSLTPPPVISPPAGAQTSVEPPAQLTAPRSFGDFVGQTRVVQRLELAVAAAKQRREALDHILLVGAPGTGKTTLAHIIAKAMGVNLKSTSGVSITEAVDLAGFLCSPGEGDVLFIEEIHRLQRIIEESLYPALEDFRMDVIIDKGPNARLVHLNLPRFTLIGTAPRKERLSQRLLSYFPIVETMAAYSVEELTSLAIRFSRLLNSDMEELAAAQVARSSDGTPRDVLRYLRRVRDYADFKGFPGMITADIASKALELFAPEKHASESVQSRDTTGNRTSIPSKVRREVWRRDGGRCAKCGSRDNLEYDHIIPVSKGGSNTARNIELLCESCNRSKSASIQ